MNAMRALAVAGIAMSLAGCPAGKKPSPKDTADYLGLADGKTSHFQSTVDNLAETFEVHQSSLLPDAADNPEGLVFDLAAKKSGFPDDERTLSLEVSLTDVKIVRFGDCVAHCEQPSKKIALALIPLSAGKQAQTEVDTAITDVQDGNATVHDVHTFLVGDEGGVTEPAGDFQAFTLSWTRARDGASGHETASALIRIAPDTGIVAWDGFDNSHLVLAP